MLILTILALISLISSLTLRCFYCIMSQQQNHIHENYVSTANRIKAVSRIAIQTCRVCKLLNRFCYVIAAMFDKCASCAEIDKIIKHCEIISSNYINNQNTLLNHIIVSSLNLLNDVFIHSFLDLLKDTYTLNSIRFQYIFVFNCLHSLKVDSSLNFFNSSTNDSCFLLSSIDCSAQIFRAMKNKLTTMKNKLKTLKIENCRLFDRIKELKTKVESMNEMKNVDAAIDFLDRNFNDEKREYENE
jgi:hypothetical protein